MQLKTCPKCGLPKPLDEFYRSDVSKDGRRSYCQDCEREWARQQHALSRVDLRYFVIDKYNDKLARRVSGTKGGNTLKSYIGLPICSKAEFVEWSLAQPELTVMFDSWVAAEWPRRLCPSIDRLNSTLGYTLDPMNLQWITWSENASRSHRKVNNGNN